MKNIKQLFRQVGKYARYIDYPLVVTYLLLCLIGLVMVYSASMVAATKGSLTGGNPVSGTYFYTRQLIYVIMSLCIVFFMAFFLNVKFLATTRFQKWMMALLVILLLATLVVGSNINGSKSWINLGFMNLQASELLKIGIILYIPYMIEKKRPRVFTQPKLLTSPIILAGFCIGLVFLQRDVGQTLLILIIFFAILFYAGIGVQKSIKYILTILVGAVIIGSLLLLLGLVPDYLTARFSTLANPFSTEEGTGYHIANSLLAIGNGGLFELANKTSSYFYKLVCVGVASYIGSQTFVNLGGISGTIPLTGVPLPFLSFGGSSMISLSIAMGLLLITAKQIKIDEQRLKKQQQNNPFTNRQR